MIDCNKISVVIPIYEEKLNNFEKVSLEQALNIFKNYDIFFVSPEDYSGDIPKGVRIKYFHKKYFKSVKTYNQLMLDISFYECFITYKYILIYQLDAFVFEDKLSYFCSLGYDYIGAPWLSGIYHYIDKNHCIWKVGNGGLSLRNVYSFIKVLKEYQDIICDCIINEDIFYSSVINKDFRIAPIEIALQFSFERQVLRCFKRNNQQLPFGCHAWMRYNFKFWKPFIERYGYDLEDSSVYQGYEDEILAYKYKNDEINSFIWENIYCNINIQDLLRNLFGRELEAYIVFGAGYFGQEICNILERSNIKIKCVVDNNKDLWEKNLGKYRVKNINQIRLDEEQGIIVAVKDHINEIMNQLDAMGYIYYENYVCLQDLFI